MREASDKILVALNANAFSTRWDSRRNDRRGEALNTFIDNHGLEVVNLRSVHTTFNGPRGRTNIDVTITDSTTKGKVSGWTVQPGVTSSDHQLIRYSLELTLRRFESSDLRFDMSRANQESFLREFEIRSAYWFVSSDIDSLAQSLHEDVMAAVKTKIPTVRRRKRVKPPWWTHELDIARRSLRASARRLRDGSNRLEFNAMRNAYTALLRKNKIASWRAFTTAEGRLPWGRLYRWLKNGNRAPLALV